MGKVRIQAGAEIDVLDRKELADTLKSWAVELTRGAKLRRRSIFGTTDAAGVLVMGDSDDGPHEGMCWAVTRLSIAPTTAVIPAGGLQVYANDVSSSSLLIRSLLTDQFPGDHAVNLMSGDSLRIGGSGITANAPVIVTISIKEVPELMAWSL